MRICNNNHSRFAYAHNKLQLIQYIGPNAAIPTMSLAPTAHQLPAWFLAEPTQLPPYKTLNKFTTQNSTWSLVARFLQGRCKNNPATNTLLSGHEAIFLVM